MIRDCNRNILQYFVVVIAKISTFVCVYQKKAVLLPRNKQNSI